MTGQEATVQKIRRQQKEKTWQKATVQNVHRQQKEKRGRKHEYKKLGTKQTTSTFLNTTTIHKRGPSDSVTT